MNTQQKQYEIVDKCIARLSHDVSSEKLGQVLAQLVGALWLKASHTLSEVTLDVIFERARHLSMDRFPLLASFKIDHSRPPIVIFSSPEKAVDNQEVIDAFRCFLITILNLVGNLTSDILLDGLYLELKTVLLQSPGAAPLDRHIEGRPSTIARVLTHISNLDEILSGGLPEGTITIVAGPIEQKTYQLEILYDISKAIASFETLEKTFPVLMNLVAKAIPIRTSVLIEGKEGTKITTIWHTEGVTQEQVNEAMTLGNQIYEQLTGPTLLETIPKLNRASIVLPLAVYFHPPFGVLVLQGWSRLNESDLAFADIITNLISIALDRYYAHNLEKFNEKLIADLEVERDLRESFVSTLTHDLRNSLGATKLYAGVSIGKSDNPDICKKMSQKIIGSIDHVDQMIENLLDANRIRAGEKLPLKIEEFDLRDMLKTALGELSAVSGDRIVFTDDQKKVPGYWSRSGIRRAIENLINNALKYGAPDRPITVSLEQTIQAVQIAVHNEGNPIPPADLANLFQMHQRSKSAQDSGVRGWGLGLTLIRGMVEAHGGSVQVESTSERGTTFTMILPKDCRNHQQSDEITTS